MFKNAWRLAFLALLLPICGLAIPVSMTYTVSGTPGDYTLDFSLTNNIPAADGMAVYFFGVQLSDSGSMGVPNSDWGAYALSWSISGEGGSSLLYNDLWASAFYSGEALPSGSTLSGFTVQFTGSVVPVSVPFFAFGVYGEYGGTDNFNTSTNPGFEGTATASGLLGVDCIAIIFGRFIHVCWSKGAP